MAVETVGRSVAARPVRRIERTTGFGRLDVQEFWHYRELLVTLIWRDVRVRYKQTFLGPVWAILRPLIQTVVFTFVFHRVGGIDSGTEVPYAVFSFVALSAWSYFASALSGGSMSLLSNAGLITKIYFPREYVALTAVVAPLVDLVLSFTAGAVLFAVYGVVPSRNIVFAPLFLLMALFVALGLGLLLAPLTVRYRDVPFALPFLTQLWMFVTPVVYPLSKVLELMPDHLHWVPYVNPLTAPIVGFRWSLIGGDAPTTGGIVSCVLFGLFLTLSGFVWFRRAERSIADVF